MSLNLEMNKTYTFNTKAPSILGAVISNAKLVGILNHQLASTYENIDIKYKAILPLLPPSTPDYPETSIYYRFISESGEPIILADVWINDATVQVINHIRFRINFPNSSVQDKQKIQEQLIALGYNNFTIVEY